MDDNKSQSVMRAYGFGHQSISPNYIKDMRGNSKYSLNMDHIKP